MQVSADEGEVEGTAVVLDGYSSTSTFDDASSTAEPPHLDEHDEAVAFDRDDDAACDHLLLDILSGSGEEGGADDGFLSLLADDMIANEPSSEGASHEALEGLNGFVKREIEF